jgi:hypothetical protein
MGDVPVKFHDTGEYDVHHQSNLTSLKESVHQIDESRHIPQVGKWKVRLYNDNSEVTHETTVHAPNKRFARWNAQDQLGHMAFYNSHHVTVGKLRKGETTNEEIVWTALDEAKSAIIPGNIYHHKSMPLSSVYNKVKVLHPSKSSGYHRVKTLDGDNPGHEFDAYNDSLHDIHEAKRGRPPMHKIDNAEEEDTGDRSIMMQMRKAVSMKGQKAVEFANGDKANVPAEHAKRAIIRYDAMRPTEKEQFQYNISRSHAAFKKHLGVAG